MIFAFRRCLILAPIFLAIASIAQAQTDYFWLPPVGGSGTWDTSSLNWSDGVNTAPNYVWQSNGGERANFGGGTGGTFGTVTLGVPVTAYGLNFATPSYVINGGGNSLTLSGAGGVINSGSGAGATINAQIAGSVGLTKTGSGILTLNAANTYSGTTTVSTGTLLGVAQASGSPFSSGPVTLSGGSLQLKSATASLSTTTNVGDLTVSGSNTNAAGTSQLAVDDTLAGGSATTTFSAGNLVHGGVGSALVVTPSGGPLGTADLVKFSNGNSLVTNGILPPWVVMSTGTGPADYVSYGANGVTVASYSSTDITTATSTSVVNQTATPTITGNVSAYALKDSAAIDLTGHTLTLGNGSGQSGLILNAGSVTNGNISFGSTEGVVYAQGTTSLGSAGTTISGNGLTFTALGTTNLTINGTIANGTAPSLVTFSGVTSGSSLTLAAANSYTGGTVLSFNTGSAGNVFLGNDLAFGTGKVTSILVPGQSSPQLQASGGDRTLANAFDLNGGITFTGANNFTLTGPMNVINSAVSTAPNSSRTLQASFSTAGKSLTLGSTGSPSTITLGNPVSNGGDGVGKTLVLSAVANASVVVNDVMQDPSAGGGGSVQLGAGGTNTGTIVLNSQSTYTGATFLGGAAVIQWHQDYNAGDPSGPFGLGTFTPNNSTNNNLQPTGGGTRILGNPVLLNTGFTISNTSGDSTGLTLTGPVTFTNTRTIANNFTAGTGGTLTFGSGPTPPNFTLAATTTGQTMTVNGAGKTTFNSPIVDTGAFPSNITIGNTGTTTFNGAQSGDGNLTMSGATNGGTLTINAPRSGAGIVTISAGATASPATVNLNAQSTYSGGTNLSGPNTVVNIATSSNALPGQGFSSGPFGTGTINSNNGTNQHLRPVGNQSISNTFTMTFGIAMDNAVGDQSNLTLAGPINMTDNNGRTISNGFSGQTNTGGTLFLGDPSSPSVLTMGNNTGTGNVAMQLGGWTGPIVVNDTIVDPVTFTKAYQINITPNAQTYPIVFNAQNTYSGGTNVGTGAGSGGVELGTNSTGDPNAVVSGPLGTGAVNAVSTVAAPPPLIPFNADRTLANSINLNGNLGAGNASGQTNNLNLTGTIQLGTASRSIVNNMTGTLTLGQSTPAASFSNLTLSQTAAQALTFTGASTSTTVVNDVIQNGGGGIIPGNIIVSGGIVQFNNANSYGISAVSGTTVSGGKLLVNNTSGSGTGVGDVTVSGGTLGGNGTIGGSVAATSGAIAPGNSAGILNVSGNVSFGASAGFNVEIGGTTPGVGGYDQLAIGGVADLSGSSLNTTLNASLLPGFTLPTLATDFTILTAASGVNLGGGFGFGSVVFPDSSGRWTVNYNPNSIVLHLAAAPAGVAGDYNHNGVVDAADYVVWRNQNGQTGSGLAADGNHDDVVNSLDFDFWRSHFGNTSGSGSSLAGGAAVPEPGMLSLLICGLGALVCSAPRASRR